jgi:signal transduction histidine kinase
MGGAEITVKDNGRGMSAAEQRRAFEPGYTTKPRGWGLGLALARRVVEEYHGGKLSVRKSVPGEGTTIGHRPAGGLVGKPPHASFVAGAKISCLTTGHPFRHARRPPTPDPVGR